MVATNSLGTRQGTDRTFTTANPPAPTVMIEPATNVGQTSAAIAGTVNPNGGATTAFFEYGPTTDYGSTTTTQSVGSGSGIVPLTAALSALVAGTQYHFRLVATNAGGTTDGPNGSFTTQPPPPTVAITPPTQGDIGATFATLRGTVNPNGVQTTGITFEYGLTTAYGTSVAISGSLSGNTAQSVTSPKLSGLVPGMTYHYRLSASTSQGISQTSDASITTLSSQVPVAVPDTMFVSTQTAQLDVVANDVNADTGETGLGLTFDGITQQGDFGVASGGPVVSYDPNASFDLDGDSFQYQIRTNANQTAIGTVTVIPFAAVRGSYGGTISGATETDGVGRSIRSNSARRARTPRRYAGRGRPTSCAAASTQAVTAP